MAPWGQHAPPLPGEVSGGVWAPVAPTVLAAPHLRRFQMGWKYLEVLIAKMMLGTRKKVHHARQNQKAFWSRGCGVSSPGLGSSVPQAPTASVRGRRQCSQSRVQACGRDPASPQVLLMHPPRGP